MSHTLRLVQGADNAQPGEKRASHRGRPDEHGEWLRDYVDGQDICAWVTQGAIADRTREHLGRSDLGVIMLRKLYFEQMERVEASRDPICTYRDPDRNVCIE